MATTQSTAVVWGRRARYMTTHDAGRGDPPRPQNGDESTMDPTVLTFAGPGGPNDPDFRRLRQRLFEGES